MRKPSICLHAFQSPSLHYSWEVHCHHRNQEKETEQLTARRKKSYKKNTEEQNREAGNNCENSSKVNGLVKLCIKKEIWEIEKRISHESVNIEFVTHCRCRVCLCKCVSGALYFWSLTAIWTREPEVPGKEPPILTSCWRSFVQGHWVNFIFCNSGSMHLIHTHILMHVHEH